MKKFLVPFPSFFMFHLLPGATAARQPVLSGSLSIHTINQNSGEVFTSMPLSISGADVSSTSVEIAPSLGYLFSGNLAAGLEVSYTNSSTTVEQAPSFTFFFLPGRIPFTFSPFAPLSGITNLLMKSWLSTGYLHTRALAKANQTA